jgi:chemotaxis protein CheZ
MPSVSDKRLKSEIFNLSQYIERFRLEIARLNKGEPDSNFKNMSDHLDAIIEHTDMATHAILQNLEEISDLVGKIHEKAADPEAAALCDQAMEKTTHAMEACTFQDITGQRVTKVVKALQDIEAKVDSLITAFGDEIAEYKARHATDADDEAPAEVDEASDDMLLQGPQLAGDAMSQDEIDKLLNSA